MLTEERQSYILKCLRNHKIVKSQDLMAHTDASESTIRRDLQELADQGLLSRIHGGAKRIDSLMAEPSQLAKANTNLAEKKAIAAYAVHKIHQDDVLYLDAGTTIQAMIPFLNPQMNLTIVTNGIDTASLLTELPFKILLVGGQIKNLTKAVIGAKAIEQVSQYRFDVAFLGTNGIDGTYGFSTPDPEEGILKRTIMNQSAKSYILSDVSKFGRITFDRFANLQEAQLITGKVPAKFRDSLQQATIEEVDAR